MWKCRQLDSWNFINKSTNTEHWYFSILLLSRLLKPPISFFDVFHLSVYYLECLSFLPIALDYCIAIMIILILFAFSSSSLLPFSSFILLSFFEKLLFIHFLYFRFISYSHISPSLFFLLTSCRSYSPTQLSIFLTNRYNLHATIPPQASNQQTNQCSDRNFLGMILLIQILKDFQVWCLCSRYSRYSSNAFQGFFEICFWPSYWGLAFLKAKWLKVSDHLSYPYSFMRIMLGTRYLIIL